DEKTEDEKKEEEKPNETNNELLEKLKEILKDEVKDVKVSNKLVESPACLVFDQNDPSFAMQQILKQMGQDKELPEIKPILEVNLNHQIFNKMNSSNNFSNLEDVAYILLDQAKLIEGMKVKDIVSFTKRVNKILGTSI
ncbi:MAG: molecular chaperone HtpG, partial [Campylobacterales bacterium]|nr:molecular chaperone HtpG [Campylobacterales bacterium]